MQAGFLKRSNEDRRSKVPVHAPEQALASPAVLDTPPPAPPAQEVPGVGAAPRPGQQEHEQQQWQQQQQQQEEEEEEEEEDEAQQDQQQHKGEGAQATGDVLASDNWRACLQLLASAKDEEKFVGLLLATKLLPHGSDQAVQQVVEAVSLTFLQRLLLPLLQQRQGAQVAPTAEQQQQHLCCTLALSILSAACHVPAVAGSPGFVQLLPPLLTVVASSGAASALGLAAGADGAADDGSSWLDAMQCSAAAAAVSEQGRRAALSSQALPAAAGALHQAVQDLCRSSSSSDVQQVAQAATCVQASVRLLAALLQGPPLERHHLVQQYPQQLAAAVQDLAAVFGQQLAIQTSSSKGGSSQGPDAASLQLDTLHLLLLLLPPPAASSMAAALQQHSGSSSRGGVWAQGLQAGLLQLLVGRVGAVQRLSALQLAAAMVELLGPQWLLCTPPSSSPSRHHQPQPALASTQPPDNFTAGGPTGAAALLRPLVEVLCVEMPLLLSDAMSPDAVVPALSPATMAAGQWAPPAPKQQGPSEGHRHDTPLRQLQQEQEVRATAMHEDQQQQEVAAAGTRDFGQQEPNAAPAAPLAAPAASSPSQAAAPGIAEACPPAGTHAAATPGGAMLAGERAAVLLPACYQLLEAVLEVLVAEEGDEAGSEWGTRQGGQQPVLSSADTGHLMRRVQELAQVLQDFLVYMSGEQGPGRSAASRDLVVLGAVRCLGRLCSEAPEAAGEQVAALLPFMLQVQAPGAADQRNLLSCAGGGVSFLLPALHLWTTNSSSSSSMSPAALVVKQLRRSPEAGAALLQYLAAISQQAAAMSAAALGGSPGNQQQQVAGRHEAGAAAVAHMELLSVNDAPINAVTPGEGANGVGGLQAAIGVADAEGVLVLVCEVVLALLGHDVEQVLLVRQRWCGGPGNQGAPESYSSICEAPAADPASCAAAWAAAAQGLCAWAAARQQQQQQQQQQAVQSIAGRWTAPGDQAAAEVVSSCAAVMLQPASVLVLGQLLAVLVVSEHTAQGDAALPLAPPALGQGAAAAAVVWALTLGWSAMLVCLQHGLPGSSPGDQQQWQEVLEAAGVSSDHQGFLEDCWDGSCEAAALLVQVDPSLRPLLLQADWLQPAVTAGQAAAPSPDSTSHKRGRWQGQPRTPTAQGWGGSALAHAVWQQSLHLQLLVQALL